MPVQPTAHYAMGGIPTNINAEVVITPENTVLPGLYAAGECACVSVHGANRLGTNSLVDILVFGRRAGQNAAAYAVQNDLPVLPVEPEAAGRIQLESIRDNPGAESAAEIRKEMRNMMMDHVGVYRTAELLTEALARLEGLKRRYRNISIMDKGKRWNTELLEAWELGCLLDLAEATTVAALARTESRGAHYREDFPERDDVNWLAHSLAYLEPEGQVRMETKPVTLGLYEPKQRVY